MQTATFEDALRNAVERVSGAVNQVGRKIVEGKTPSEEFIGKQREKVKKAHEAFELCEPFGFRDSLGDSANHMWYREMTKVVPKAVTIPLMGAEELFNEGLRLYANSEALPKSEDDMSSITIVYEANSISKNQANRSLEHVFLSFTPGFFLPVQYQDKKLGVMFWIICREDQPRPYRYNTNKDTESEIVLGRGVRAHGRSRTFYDQVGAIFYKNDSCRGHLDGMLVKPQDASNGILRHDGKPLGLVFSNITQKNDFHCLVKGVRIPIEFLTLPDEKGYVDAFFQHVGYTKANEMLKR